MKRLAIALIAAVVLTGWASPARAGGAEEKEAVRQAAAWAAQTVARELPAAPKVKERGVERLLLVVGPWGDHGRVLGEALQTAVANLPGFTVVWDPARITEFVDRMWVHPKDPRYDPDTLKSLGGAFPAAQAVLIVHHAVGQESGGERVDVTLGLWDLQAEQIWGAQYGKALDLGLLGEIDALVSAGRIEEALPRIAPALEAHPEWRVALEALRAKAEQLKGHGEALARIQTYVDQSRVDEALSAIRQLAEEAPTLADPLRDLLADVRGKLVAPLAALVDAGDLAGAKARMAALEARLPDDLDLATMLARVKARVLLIEQEIRDRREADERAAEQTKEAAAEAEAARLREEQGKRDDEQRRGEQSNTLLYVGGGLLAALILGIALRGALRKRQSVAIRNRGIDALKGEAEQADRVHQILQKDQDLRAKALRELDRADDALADAHHRAQEAGKAEVAQAVYAANERLQELKRRVKMVANGDPQAFLKGRLPKRNLEGLVSWLFAVAGEVGELTREATAARDAVVAGGSPEKNLELLKGIGLRIQGKLSEREGFFRTMA